MERVHLDNCMTTKPDPLVIEAMMPFLTEKYFLPSNFVSTGSNSKKCIQECKQIVAKSLNADESEIHLTSGGTSANNIGIKGYIMANAHKGNHIICSQIDYPDILTNAAFFEENGFDVTYLGADWDGYIDLEKLKSSLRKETILVMTTLANHVLGTIQSIKKIKEIINCHPSKTGVEMTGSSNSNIALFVDAGHAYGRMPIDVKELDVDILSFSAHKINGPQGAGALFVKKGTKIAQTKHGIVRIDNLDTGGISLAALAGMAKAIELQFNDLQGHIDYMRSLQNRLLQGIEEKLGKVLVNGAWGENRICHNLNISIENVEGEGMMMMLDMFGINVATGSACSSQGLQPNYIMMATGRNFVQSHGSMKFTLSRLTTQAEIDYTIVKFVEVVGKLRKITSI
ncbi:MAG: cysteine desulfurase [Candidatus Cloacimonetes bacterium]|nr:cysteine desulfurase [Candidatus Cloacimonadota bacterium]